MQILRRIKDILEINFNRSYEIYIYLSEIGVKNLFTLLVKEESIKLTLFVRRI